MHCREIYVRAIPLETRRGMPFPKWQGVKMLEKVVGGNENCRGGSGRGSKSGARNLLNNFRARNLIYIPSGILI